MLPARRKVAFSGKAKKEQLRAKKNRQNLLVIRHGNSDDDSEENDGKDNFSCDGSSKIQEINKQPHDNTGKNRYALQFFQESKKELQERKEDASKTITLIPLKEQEVSDNYFPPGIDMPKRPPWDVNMSKEHLEMKEQRYFTEYLKSMEELDKISYFELNLETWRQLWRVLEKSDILLMIVDIRYPVLMFPPYLYNYITEILRKDMILVLNKIDLAPPALVVAWHEYFKSQYPKLRILFFTSFPTYNIRGNNEDGAGLKQRRRKGKLRMAAEGAQKLLETCKSIVGDKVDLTSWQEKIHEEMNLEYDLDDLNHKDNVVIEKEDTGYFHHGKYQNGVVTIGFIGTPNVGKSSFMNAVMGKKVVSVSRTPGHTKYFQTIFLTKTVCLCDCPGLVFPSTVPKQLQILMGSFPIAQVREPYTTIKYLGERVDLPTLLRIQHQENDDTWSAIDICDGWAAKRNYMTARTSRLDTYRAANSLLRMALEGKICLFIYPVGWTSNKVKWENHSDVEMIKWIQASVHRNTTVHHQDEIQSDDEESKASEESPSENSEEEEEEEEEEEYEGDDDDYAGPSMTTSNKFNLLDAD